MYIYIYIFDTLPTSTSQTQQRKSHHGFSGVHRKPMTLEVTVTYDEYGMISDEHQGLLW